ncbi:MAG TPA: response regulator [Vicinamibacterales bacterium]|nr:response regulator [Vicinamibacterales bacterium]
MTKLSVLVVDDDASTIETFVRMLTLEGFDACTATNARDALAQALAQPPDAIILDLRMPLVDGLQLLTTLRAHDATRATPVVIVTGDYFIDESVVAAANALGAAVRFKPLWLEDLLALTYDLLGMAAAG